jgi:hypothetical protein
MSNAAPNKSENACSIEQRDVLFLLLAQVASDSIERFAALEKACRLRNHVLSSDTKRK